MASVEASLDATNRAIKLAGNKQAAKAAEASLARSGNELMDRKGGGPVRWQDFYGRTAANFYYHPPRGSVEITHTDVFLALPPSGLRTSVNVTVQDQLPMYQRPPQFDYIYRANADNQKRAEADVAKMAGKIDALTKRRRDLEAEQSALWCKIAFRAVSGNDCLRRPIYSLGVSRGAEGTSAREQSEATNAAIVFFRSVGEVIEDAETSVDVDQSAYLARLSRQTTGARGILAATVARHGDLGEESRDPNTALGKMMAVAKRMEDESRNGADAFRLALSGDSAGDDQRKETFRGLLQQSLADLAEAMLACDECINTLMSQWKLVTASEPLPVTPPPHDDRPASQAKQIAVLVTSEPIAIATKRKQAESGDGNAMFEMGIAYEFGNGVRPDPVEAFSWYTRAVDAGNTLALGNLGQLYSEGRGVAKDPTRGFQLSKKLADLGNAWGMYYVAVAYDNGAGVAKNPAEAISWYKRAIAGGLGVARTRLADLYLQSDAAYRNDAEALRLYREAADGGDEWAMDHLGALYENGRCGLPVDKQKAADLFERSYRKGCPGGAYDYGRALEQGIGRSVDRADARKCYEFAAERGIPSASEALQRIEELPGPTRSLVAQPSSPSEAIPTISGVWQEPHGDQYALVHVTQKGETWSAECSYIHPLGGEVRWQMSGKITRDGRIHGSLQHTKVPPGWQQPPSQVRDATLSSDGKSIEGTYSDAGKEAQPSKWVRQMQNR